MEVFYSVKDCGDGDSAIVFYDSADAQRLDEECDPTAFGSGEQGSFTCDNFSDSLTTIKDVRENHDLPSFSKAELVNYLTHAEEIDDWIAKRLTMLAKLGSYPNAYRVEDIEVSNQVIACRVYEQPRLRCDDFYLGTFSATLEDIYTGVTL